MRFKVNIKKNPEHSELASCVGWNTADEVYSSSDDHQVLKTSLLNQETGKVCNLPNDVYPTDMHWFPKIGGSKKQAGSDVFALAATDGKQNEYQQSSLSSLVSQNSDNIILLTPH